jgi:[ribosomal protein S5]-alanine N-acetyltransferase
MVLRLGSVLFETHRSVEDSEAFLRLAVEGYERGDFGGWGVVLKDSGVFVGTCGVDVNYAPERSSASASDAWSSTAYKPAALPRTAPPPGSWRRPA